MEWPLLEGVPAQDVRQVLAIVRRHRFSKGEVVFHQGDLGDNVYIIEKGECEVVREEQHVADLGAGDYFGEMAVLGNVSRNATVRAVVPTDVLLIPRGDFHLLKTGVPAFGAVFEDLARVRAAKNKTSEEP